MDGNSADFQVKKSFLVHNPKLAEVYAELVTINGTPYIGLKRKSFKTEEESNAGQNQSIKSILLPVQAWSTVVNQASPQLVKEALKLLPKTPPPKVAKNSIENLPGWLRAPKKVQPAEYPQSKIYAVATGKPEYYLLPPASIVTGAIPYPPTTQTTYSVKTNGM